MNARSRFSQSSISNGHTACGLTKKTIVREKRKKRKKKCFSRVLQQSICPWRSDTVTDQRFSTEIMDQYRHTPVYRSSPCLEWCPTAGASLFRIISPVISGYCLFKSTDFTNSAIRSKCMINYRILPKKSVYVLKMKNVINNHTIILYYLVSFRFWSFKEISKALLFRSTHISKWRRLSRFE